jgi:hypothetical protein
MIIKLFVISALTTFAIFGGGIDQLKDKLSNAPAEVEHLIQGIKGLGNKSLSGPGSTTVISNPFTAGAERAAEEKPLRPQQLVRVEFPDDYTTADQLKGYYSDMEVNKK